MARTAATALGLSHLPMLVDSIDDSFLRTFAAWPIRMYGVGGGASKRIERIAQPRDAAFTLAPLRDWLLDAAAASSPPQP